MCSVWLRRSQQSFALASNTTNSGVSLVLLCVPYTFRWLTFPHSETREIRKRVWGFILSLGSVFLSLAGMEDFEASTTSCPQLHFHVWLLQEKQKPCQPSSSQNQEQSWTLSDQMTLFSFLEMMDRDKMKCVASVQLLVFVLDLWGKYCTSLVKCGSNAFLQSATDQLAPQTPWFSLSPSVPTPLTPVFLIYWTSGLL